MQRTARLLQALGPALALALAVTAVTADVLLRGRVRRLDWTVHEFFDPHLHHGPGRAAVVALSLVGQRGIVVVPLLVVACLAARRHRTLRPIWVALGALVGIAVIVLALKAAVGRVAPSSGHDIVHAGGVSYPSGHAINAIVCWGLVLELAAGLGERARRILTRPRRRLITTGLAAAAGLSMIALDYHWLSDVIAGWFLGVLLLGILLCIGRPYEAEELSQAARPGGAQPGP